MLKNSLILIAAFHALSTSAATIVIQNNDTQGEGFNDPLSATEIPAQKGNNPGETLGEMRLKVFEEAARIWGDILNSRMVITIGATFDPMLCDDHGATLGTAGATGSYAGFKRAQPAVAYHVALAESVANMELNFPAVEVTSTFNSRIDSDETCLGGAGFYYGLDANIPEGMPHLLPAVLHEFAHGLGFSSMADLGPEGSGGFTGAGGFPDAYSRNLYDLDIEKSWSDMSPEERKASALNAPALVWSGARVTADRGKHLVAAPELVIHEPAGIAGVFPAVLGEAPWMNLPPGGVTAGVRDGNTFENLDGDPADGCSQLDFASYLTGLIALFDSTPACFAGAQALWSQVEAAAGVLIVATTETGLPDVSGYYTSPPISIPYIGVEKSVGVDLRANLDTASVTIRRSTESFLGDNQGRVTIFAPGEYIEGISNSHWSPYLQPDLLMKPYLGLLDYADVDLSAAAMRDIGWSVNIPGEPPELISGDGFEGH